MRKKMVEEGIDVSQLINETIEDEFSEEIKQKNEIIVLNVGGTKFKVLKSNFAYWPKTRLSRLIRAKTEKEILSLCESYVIPSPGCKEEYYFHRDWSNFNSILDIYRNRNLHSTIHICCMNYHGDLKFWGIDELILDPCCAVRHYPEVEQSKREAKLRKRRRHEEEQRKLYEDFGTSWIGRIRNFFWNLTEYPETSLGAKVSRNI